MRDKSDDNIGQGIGFLGVGQRGAVGHRAVSASIPPLDPDGLNYYLYFDPTNTASLLDNGGSPLLLEQWYQAFYPVGTVPPNAASMPTYASQVSGTNQPQIGSGAIYFVDNDDRLTLQSAVTQAGWMVVGTSLGTFAYRVNNTSLTDIALLGKWVSGYAQSGLLYGWCLLPESSTAKQVEGVRKFFISLGAADGVTVTTLQDYWRSRSDIVEFKKVDTSGVTNFTSAWQNCNSLTSFPLLNTAKGNNFSSAWRFCSSLTSFPLLDTAAGTNFSSAWRFCSSLTSFPLIDTAAGTGFSQAWRDCTSLTDFPANFFNSWNPASISSGVFDVTWGGCSSLTSQSVENILVSIDTSGKYATASGLSGGTSLTDPVIDIDYDNSGLTAATTTAITSLKSKGWGITINGFLQ